MSEEEQERLSSEEFVDLIPHLPFQNILQIEFFSTDWKTLIVLQQNTKHLYQCNLCGIVLSGSKSVISHINGKKHLGSMSYVKCFYHPEYTFTKAQLRTSHKRVPSSSNKPKAEKSAVVDVKSNTNQKVASTNTNTKNETKTSQNGKPQNVNNEKDSTQEKSYETATKGGDTNKTKATNATSSNNLKTKEPVVKTQDIQKTKQNDSGEQESTNNEPAKSEKVAGVQENIKKNGEKNAEPKNDNKPLVRIIPISKLQKQSGEKPSGSESAAKNNVDSKTSTAGKSENVDSKNQKAMPNDKSKNPNESLQKSAEKETKNISNQKEKSLENTSRVPNNEDSSPKNATRKIVKNPLAARQNTDKDQAEKSENSQNKAINVENIPSVIVLDDTEDDDEVSQSKVSKPEKNVKESEPPAKKPKAASPTPQVVARETQAEKLNKSTDHGSSLITISTQNKVSPIKSKEKSSDEPKFAVKSVVNTVDNDEISGFVGIEYVIKIVRNGTPIKYECGLCELILDGQSMQNHLLGYSHRLRFCEKHFPTAIQQSRQYIINVPSDEHYKVMIPVLQKLSVAIEEHHGRSLPCECDERRYNMERHRVLTEVFGRRHASEQQGPTFTHVIDSKQVDEFILKKDSMKLQPNTSNQITFDIMKKDNQSHHGKKEESKRRSYETPAHFKSSNHDVRPYSSNQGPMQPFYPNNANQLNSAPPYVGQNTFMDDETHKRMVDNFLKANSTTNLSQYKSSRSSRNEKEHRHSLKRPHSPPRASLEGRKEQNMIANIWSSYCRLVDNKLKILRENFQKYRVNPESHPSYKDEWLKFWHRRKAELMAKGKDYRTYNFQPDWVPYFNNRINELYDEAFERVKIESREELSLPMTNYYLGDPKYFVHVNTETYTPAAKKMTPPMPTNMPALSAQDSSLNMPSSYNMHKEPNPSVYPSRPMGNIADSKIKANLPEIEAQGDSAPTMVSVLRLLTALEEHLGSLGPKIVELLSKALQAEKCNQGGSIDLLTEENCTILETAMEKFKGLVIAGILDSPKERAVKKAISNVTALLEHTKEIRKREGYPKQTERESIVSKSNTYPRTTNDESAQNVNDKLKQVLQSIANSNDISKVIHLIEDKIAAALKAQGRNDVDRANLEQLAAVCVLLEKKKQEASGVQQPLSDSLKRIVSSMTEKSSTEQNTFNDQGRFPNSAANNSSSRLQNQYNPTNNVSLDNLINNVGSQGNFSNSYGNYHNQTSSMGDNSNFGGNFQSRNMPQQQIGVSSSLGWQQNSRNSWTSNQAPTSTTSAANSQRYGNQNFGQKPSGQDRYRYNLN